MPDLKSELMKLNDLKFDDDVANVSAPITEDKPNITKLIWDAVKAHPKSTSNDVANYVTGGDMEGVTTRLKQLINRELIFRTWENNKYRYTAVGEAYPVLNRQEVIAKANAARKESLERKRKQREYNAKYKARLQEKAAEVTATRVPATSLTSNPSAEQLVNSMSVGMAKAVYLELKKVFEQ